MHNIVVKSNRSIIHGSFIAKHHWFCVVVCRAWQICWSQQIASAPTM